MDFPPKIVFFGTPKFAVPVLKLLYQNDYKIILVVTQPDKPIGRKQILTPSPVKIEADKFDLRVIYDLKTGRFPPEVPCLPAGRDSPLAKRDYQAAVGIAAAYGQLIPQEILDIFSKGCLNIHPSLLPKYRGPSPIQTAILNGDKVTGVSIIKLDEKMDHGDVISNSQLAISNSDTYQTLSRKLAEIGARLLIKTLPLYLEGRIKAVPQDDYQATFTKILKRQDGKIVWQKSATEIERQIRAYTPWPGSYSEFDLPARSQCFATAKAGIRNLKLGIKILQVKVSPKNFSVRPGNFCQENNQLYIQCSKDSLLIKKLQPEGKKAISGQEFINGYLS